jgi:cardiolipin synthase
MTAGLSPLRHIPNVITVVRVLLIIPTAWCLWNTFYVEALVLMAVAGASDAVDGALARRFDWSSRFGAFVDPLADKLLVGTLIVVLTLQGHMPWWLTAIVLGRDLVILTGATVYRFLFGSIEIEPRILSKINTALQIVVVLLFLLELCQLPYVSDLAMSLNHPWGVWLLAAAGVISGVDYVLSWSHRAVRESRA